MPVKEHNFTITQYQENGCSVTRIQDPVTSYKTHIFSGSRLGERSIKWAVKDFAKNLKKYKKWHDGEWLRFANSLMQ